MGFSSITNGANGNFSGHVSLEATYFSTTALYGGQRDHSLSLATLTEYYQQWDNQISFTFSPFIRVDSGDEERSHLDIREMYFIYPADSWEFRVGIDKVFWGTTEFVHLVDIINQTDLIESIDQEEKLGQPLAHLSFIQDFGTIDLFILPYFRERTFPGTGGRMRNGLAIDLNNPSYESSAEEHNLDFALRYSHVFDEIDFGVAFFKGTGREPQLQPTRDAIGQFHIIPYYGLIEQTSLDLSLVSGAWLWKLEALYRTGMEDDFLASTGGFEIMVPALGATNIDLGIIGEYGYDQRGEKSPSVFQNDLMLGLRIAFNDMASSELLLGVSKDLDHRASFISVEASRRVNNNYILFLESIVFLDQAESDISYGIRDDDNLRLGLTRYF